MPYSIKIKSGSTAFDVSDNIISLKEIPFTTRNADYTFIYDYINFDLSNINLPATFTVDNNVYIYSGSVLLYNGVIDEYNYNEGDYSYSVVVKPYITKLDNYTVQEFNFISLAYSKQVSLMINEQNRDMVPLKDLLYSIFLWGAQSTLDTSSLDLTSSYGTFYSQGAAYNGGVPSFFTTTGSIGTTYFILDQVRCIGQDAIRNVDEVLDYKDQSTSLLGLVDLICGFANLNIYPKDTGSFYVTNQPFVNNIDDDKIYNRTVLENRKKSNGYTITNLTARNNSVSAPYTWIYFPQYTDRSIYNDPGQNIAEYQYNLNEGAGAEFDRTSISTTNHFTPFVYNVLNQDAYPLLTSVNPANSLFKQYIKAVYYNFTETTIETDVITDVKVLDENYIDVKNKTSTIKTITYSA